MNTEERVAVLETEVSRLQIISLQLLEVNQLSIAAISELRDSVRTLTSALAIVAGVSDPNTPAEIVKVSPNTEVMTVKGLVKLQDIPMDDATGFPTEDWALENCVCEKHTALREEKDKPIPPTGLYL